MYEPKSYVAIYRTEEDQWALHALNENKQPEPHPVITNDESLYELAEEAKEYGIPYEAILGKITQ